MRAMKFLITNRPPQKASPNPDFNSGVNNYSRSACESRDPIVE
jgi:hypothetical protein